MESDMGEDAKPLESNATSEVIGYLLADSNQTLVGGGYKPDSPSSLLQNDKDGDSNASDGPIQMTAVALPDGTTTLQLEDGTTAYIQTVNNKVAEAVGALSDGTDLSPKFIDGQAVQLEDGTTAFLHASPKEGLQAVQLEDGSTAYIASTLNLESYDESGGTDGGGVPCVLEDPTVPKLELGSVNSLAGTSTVRAPPRLSSKAVALGDKAFRCAYEGCGRLYTTQHHLKVHERAHTGDRPFRCEVDNCNKAFATGYGLKSHTRVHTGEKPYKCVEDYCTKAFKTSGDLQKHVRTHTGERPFKCPYEGCDRSFTTSNIRKVHVRTHTGERPYVCTEENCGRAFASATNYKNHIRIHTGEKPYVCTVRGCGKRFTEYSSLYKHHVVHTHTKPYICSVCGKNYRQTSTLAMHTRTAHGILDPTEEICDEAQVDDPTGESDPESLTDNPDVPKKRPRIQLMVAGADVNDPAAMVALQAAQQAAEQAIQQVQQQQAQLELAAATRATGPQILVVTDPAQFAALQQLAIANSANDVTDNNGLSTEQTVAETEEGSLVAYSVASM